MSFVNGTKVRVLRNTVGACKPGLFLVPVEEGETLEYDTPVYDFIRWHGDFPDEFWYLHDNDNWHYLPASDVEIIAAKPEPPEVCKCNLWVGCKCGVFARDQKALLS
jgi:hypothetical protein